jgi:predicted dehydrogenase
MNAIKKNKIKILVIGLGSMGKRRVRILQKNFKDTIEITGIDKNSERNEQVEDIHGIKTYVTLDKAIDTEEPFAALVCTAPDTHAEIIMKCLNKRMHVFSELNLIKDGYDEIIKKSKESNLEIFLSSTLLYREDLQYVISKGKTENKKFFYRYHTGQYLPDWHPWENYKDFFAVNTETNGCREILAIELPWILNAFGKVNKMKVVRDKISSLEINYPDSYIIVFEHGNGIKGVVNIDVVSRKARRDLELYSEETHLFWDGIAGSLKEYDKQQKKLHDIFSGTDNGNNNIMQRAYTEELKVFIDKISGLDIKEKYTFKDDTHTLDLIDKIEGRR